MRLGRSKNPQPVRGRSRETSAPERRAAFSYYANRTPERSPNTVNNSPARQSLPAPSKNRKPVVSQLSRLPYWLALLIGLICLGKILFVSSTPKIVIVGQTTVSSTYVQPLSVYAAAASKALKSSPANHLKLTIDTSGIAAKLSKQFPELQRVAVALPLIGNRPIVYVVPTQPSLILQTASGNFALNSSGVALAQIASPAANNLVVQDNSGSAPTTGMQVLPGSTVAFVQAVAYQLRADKLSLGAFTLPGSSAYELDARVAGKPYLLKFNLQGNALQQSGTVIATLANLGTTTPSQYIDVRVPERVYYK